MSVINNDTFDAIRSLSKQYRARYIGCLGANNIGDDLLYSAIKSLFPDIGFYGGYIGRPIQFLDHLYNDKYFKICFLGGGTLIYKKLYYDRFVNDFKNKMQAAMIGVGVAAPFFWNQYNPSVLECSKWNDLLHNFMDISVRGPQSQKLLQDNGFNNVDIVGDPALFYTKDNIAPKSFRKHIGFNIGISNNMIWGGNEGLALDNFVSLANRLIDNNYKITFVPFWTKDIPYVNEALKRINSHCDIFISNDQAKLFDLLESFDLFIGEKLHSVIMAACVGTPVIMLEYRPKCCDFMMSMGLEDYNHKVNEMNLERILFNVEYIYNNMESIQNNIHRTALKYKSLLLAKSHSIYSKLLNSL
jgi:hypothetical protein